MKKEISLLLNEETYKAYLNFMYNKFSNKKSVSNRHALSDKFEYDSYIKELDGKTFAKVFAEFYKERERIIIAASMREPDEKQITMKEDYIMLGFSGDYLFEICEKLKDKSDEWLRKEENRLIRKFDVLKFAEQHLKKLNSNLNVIKASQEGRNY